MWREIAPDQQYNVQVDGHNLVVYSFGEGDEVLLCLNGGPGLREWVDDNAATPGDLDAMTSHDEAAWVAEVREHLLY